MARRESFFRGNNALFQLLTVFRNIQREDVVKHGVKIRSQSKKLHTVNLLAFDRYFQEKSTPRWIATPHGCEPHS